MCHLSSLHAPAGFLVPLQIQLRSSRVQRQNPEVALELLGHCEFCSTGKDCKPVGF